VDKPDEGSTDDEFYFWMTTRVEELDSITGPQPLQLRPFNSLRLSA
jgi:hypothetical protein